MKKNCSKMFKESFSHFSIFFVCTVFDKFLSHWPSLSAFCPFGHIKSNEACERHCSYRTLMLSSPVAVWTSTLNLQCRRSCHEGNGSLQYLTHAPNAGVTVLLSAVMLFRIDSVLDKSTHTHNAKKNRSMETIYENKKICNTSDWHLLRCTEEGPRRAMQGILSQCDCQIASINPAA